jgi:class 3 adenylate cyclase/tetratricopeptide (TPR) repeat protein
MCATPIPDGARFCPACGTEVEAPSEERRVVTVVFADIVGFTTLAEHLDPEQLKRLIDGCLQRLVADVNAFGGRVDKIVGDGVLALFGAPVAHEDDPERAVRSALRMQRSVADYSLTHDGTLRLRVGVNTGEVLVGALRAGGDYTAMGDVVNIASRLQSESPVDGVLVGETTKVLTQSAIRYEPFGEFQPRGREQTMTAWLAVETVARPGSHRRRQNSELVGRAAEVGLVVDALDFSVTRRKAFLVTIEGEGGVGKSRLADEVIARARQQWGLSVLEGACVPYGEANVWWPIAGALIRHLGLPTDDIQRLREAGSSKAAELLGLERDDVEVGRVIEAFCHLLGEPSTLDQLEPARARAELTRAVSRIIEARVKRSPLMLVIADIHWADPAFLELLERVMSALASLPFLLVTTIRPDTESAWPPISFAGYSALRIRLEPLDQASSAELVRGILGSDVDPATLARLYERSGGNPLFLEELATLVSEQGSLPVLPDSLRSMIAARLDQLPSDQRTMLDNAAVLGTSGTWSQLQHFGDARHQPATDSAFAGLVDAGLLSADGERWRFRSQSVREVVYQTLTKAARAQRHSGVALAMESVGKSVLEDVAHHWAAAAELVAEIGTVARVPIDVGERAVDQLTAAAEQAIIKMYPRSAIRLTVRALGMLDTVPLARQPAARRRLLLVRGEANCDLRRLAPALDDIRAVLESAPADGDQRAEATAHRILGEIERLGGHLERARHELDTAIAQWTTIGDDQQLARSLRGRGFVEVFGGRASVAEAFLDEADALYERIGDRLGRAWVDQHRAWAAFTSGNVVVAEERLHQAAATMRELGDLGGLGWAQGVLAWVKFMAGDTRQADEIAAVVLVEATERGDEWAQGMMLALQANLRLWEGHTEESLALAERARTRLHRLDDGYGEIQALIPMARALEALGRSSSAVRIQEELAAQAPAFGQQALGQLVDAELAIVRGDAARALASAGTVIERIRQQDVGATEPYIVRGLAELQLGLLDEAMTSLAMAREMHGETAFVLAVSSLLAAAQGRSADALFDAAAVADSPAATYLDRVYSNIAGVFAHEQLGDHERACLALDELAAVVDGTEDVIARSLAALTRMAADPPDALSNPESLETVVLPLPGWRRLIDRLAQTVPA